MTELAKWKRECLEDYVRERMSPQTFAEHCGFSLSNAHYVLNGRGWRRTKRPEGFEYPWPEREHLHSSTRFERRFHIYAAAYERMKHENLTMSEFAQAIGLSRSRAYIILEKVEAQLKHKQVPENETEKGLQVRHSA